MSNSKNTSQKRKRWQKREKALVKDKDETIHEGHPTDIIIPVMGKTGVGKSTFINTLLGKNVMRVGHDIQSCTANLQYEVLDKGFANEICSNVGSRRVIIVDTPGFDDTYVEDSEILRRIAVWLASSYSYDMKLSGIIYLQNIAEKRMEGANRRNLEMFKKLCGANALDRVMLGTTGWQEVQENVAVSREDQLKAKFWKDMIDNGSKVKRFYRNKTSAMNIVRSILERIEEPAIMQIQKELVDMKKLIPQTEAGKELLHSIEEHLEMLKEKQAPDERARREILQQVGVLEGQMKSLRLSFWAKLKSVFGL